MKQTMLMYVGVGLLAVVAATPVYAADPTAGVSGQPNFRAQLKTNREEIKDLRMQQVEIRQEEKTKNATNPGGLRGFIGKFARFFGASLVSKTGSLSSGSLVVKDNSGKQITVNLGSGTKILRRFWGAVASIDELASGDKLMIVGSWTDDTKSAVNAKLIRDESIQKRAGVFFGKITSITSGGFVLESVGRGTLTVTLASNAKIIDRRGTAITAANMVAGHTIRIRGLWDSQAKTVTEVTEVKDFSLPVKPTGAPTPAATAAPTVAPTAAQ